MLPYLRFALAYGSLVGFSGRGYGFTTVMVFWVTLESLRLYWHRQGNTHRRTSPILEDDGLVKPGRLRLARGFRWEPVHTQLMDDLIRPGQSVVLDEDGRTNQLHAVGGARNRWLDMKAGDLIQHLAVEGGSQSGKSKTLAKLLQQVVGQDDGPVVIMDPKETRALVPYARWLAKDQGRPYYEVDFANPATTTRLDPLSTCESAEHVKDRIGLMVPLSPHSPQFRVFPLGVLGRVAAMMKAVGDWWKLPDLYDTTMSMTQRLVLFKRYLAKKGIHVSAEITLVELAELLAEPPTDKVFIRQVMRDFMGDNPHERRSSEWTSQLMSNLESSLGALVSSEVAQVFSVDQNALSWERVAEEKAIVMLLTDSAAAPESGKIMAQLILQDIQGYFAKRYKSATAVFSPFYVMIDELSMVVYPQFLQQIAQGGEAGARYLLAWQSQAQLVEPLGGKAGVTALMDNLSTLITLRINDPGSAKALADSFGECTITTRSKALRVGSGRGNGPVSAMSGLTQQHQKRALIDSAWLHKLSPGHAFMRLHGQVYKVQFPLVEVPSVEVPTCSSEVGVVS